MTSKVHDVISLFRVYSIFVLFFLVDEPLGSFSALQGELPANCYVSYGLIWLFLVSTSSTWSSTLRKKECRMFDGLYRVILANKQCSFFPPASAVEGIKSVPSVCVCVCVCVRLSALSRLNCLTFFLQIILHCPLWLISVPKRPQSEAFFSV